MTRVRSHNEYFRQVGLRTIYGEKLSPVTGQMYRKVLGYKNIRKSCCNCKQRFEEGEGQWSWGEYVRGKWNTVKHFCKQCYHKEVQDKLLAHRGDCGCTIELVGYHCTLPGWLSLCYCHKLPERDMDGSQFDGCCEYCVLEQAAFDAEQDKAAQKDWQNYREELNAGKLW